MSKQLTGAQLRQLEPRYTIGGLFENGTLGPGDETAMEEIAAIRGAFGRWVNPGQGWFSGAAAPRALADGRVWRRYVGWRHRWHQLVAGPSPSLPWGLTVADMTTVLLTEPRTFHDIAELTGKSSASVVRLFVACLRDYGAEVVRGRNEFWREWDKISQQMERRQVRDHRRKWAAKKKRQRAKNVPPKT